MDRALWLFLIGLVFGGGLGFTLAAGYGVTFDGHDHAAAGADAPVTVGTEHMAPHATPLEVSAIAAPEVSLLIDPDPDAGWNLQVKTRNFDFAPRDAGGVHVDGTGHAHLYVNGVKQARLYGDWHHIPALPAGEVLIEVVLNTNDHRPLAVAGRKIAAETRLIVE